MRILLRCSEFVHAKRSLYLPRSATESADCGQENARAVHLGDSRAYQLCRKRCLNREKQTGTRQLSQDHEEGGVLRRCVGAFGLEVPQLYTGTLDDGDMLLLCTDGFYKKAPPDFFESACTRNGKQGNCIGG